MVSEIKKNLTAPPNVGLPESITLETTSGDVLVKKENAEVSNKSAKSSSFATEAKGTLDMQATIRRFVVEQDLDQPAMAAKAYQHNQTDLEFLKDKK
jgi:hypothetical protein